MPFFIIVLVTMVLGTALSILRAFLLPIVSLFGQLVVASIAGIAELAGASLAFAINHARDRPARSGRRGQQRCRRPPAL